MEHRPRPLDPDGLPGGELGGRDDHRSERAVAGRELGAVATGDGGGQRSADQRRDQKRRRTGTPAHAARA
jgi:hypothetical protein